MSLSPATDDAAFRALRRDLVRRRWSALEPRLRIEVALLALLAGGFLFWRARIAFASIAHDHGAGPVGLAAFAAWAAFAAAGAGLAGSHHARQLGGRVSGPAWLALPASPAAIRAHLAWEARLRAAWVLPAAPALLAALAGLTPPAVVAVLAAAFALVFVLASRAATAIAFATSRASAEGGVALDPVSLRLVVRERFASRRAKRTGARWTRPSRWRALWNKDLLLARRSPAVRRRLVFPVALAIASLASWWSPLEPAGARVFAFGLALLAAYAFGEWLISLAGEDPVGALRVLPVRLADLWRARVATVLAATLALGAGHALAARHLAPSALELFLVWTTGATALLGLLAVHYGITLYPEERAAQHVYTLTLGIAVAASLMIPLMGWITLIAAVLHSARRLPRWSTLDPTG